MPPVTLGQEFGGYRRQVDLACERLLLAAEGAAELPLGGTAAGTGLNAAPGFAPAVIARLGEVTGSTFREAADHFEASPPRMRWSPSVGPPRSWPSA